MFIEFAHRGRHMTIDQNLEISNRNFLNTNFTELRKLAGLSLKPNVVNVETNVCEFHITWCN